MADPPLPSDGFDQTLSHFRKKSLTQVKTMPDYLPKTIMIRLEKERKHMGDFYQNGRVTTLHNFRTRSLEDIENSLVQFSKRRPMALVLPSLFSELEGPALGHILDEISRVPYLNEIIIGLDRADRDQFEYAKTYFSRLPQHHRVLWNDGPRLKGLDKLLKEKKIAPMEMGKGRNAWYCFGYAIASGRSEAIALHDCDILTYSRQLLARLLYPVADPKFNYKFCKGYYYRATENRLSGRVTRLLVSPLIKTLKAFFGSVEFIDYLDSFRYPLAGEFSMRADVAKTIRIPSDWGLEVGILSEVLRINPVNRVCQVDIADRYDHKHQPLSQEDPGAGLSKMSIDISKAIFTKLASYGIEFNPGTFRSIKATYFRTALELAEQYHADAVINGLKVDLHAEEAVVDLFAQNIYRAGREFLANPMQSPFVPSWKRVMSAVPDFIDQFFEAVEKDNRGG
jgi:glucosyl-3-phosphoglycerate synthase